MTSTNAGIDGVFLRRATPDDAPQVQAILNSEVSAIDPTHGSFGIDIAKQIIESPGDPSPTWLFSGRDGAEPFGFGNLHPDLTARILNPVISVRAADSRFPLKRRNNNTEDTRETAEQDCGGKWENYGSQFRLSRCLSRSSQIDFAFNRWTSPMWAPLSDIDGIL